MKDDEKMFFRLCLKYRHRPFGAVQVRDIVGILYDCGYMHYKRCWYLLEKWGRIGFYDYGVTADLGWFDLSKLPERYAILITEGDRNENHP